MRFLVAVSTLALLASPALAWDQTPAPSASATGGNGGAATSHSQATAKAHASSKSQSGSTSTGGQSSAQSNGNNVSIAGSIGGGSTGGGGRAPDVYLPSIGGGGFDCPTVGFGAAGSGLGGGGGFGPSWLSTLCNDRKTVALLSELYGPTVARAYAEAHIAGVREAVAAATPAPVPAAPTKQMPAWCVASNGTVLTNHPECH